MEQVQRSQNARQTILYDIRSVLLGLFLLLAATSSGQEAIPELKKELNETSVYDIQQQIYLLNDLAWEYIYSDTDSAYHYGYRAYNLAEKHKDKYPDAVSNTYGTIAILYDIQGDNVKALELYLKSLEMKEELKDSTGISIAKTNIGALFFTQEDYEKALPYFEEALELEVALYDTLNQIGSLINISVIHKNLGNLKLAKKYLKHALSLNEQIDLFMMWDGKIYNNLGAQFLATNELDSALYYFEKGAVRHLEDKDFYDYSIALENMANVHMRLGQMARAKAKGFEALNLAQEKKYFLVQTNAAETLYEIYLANKEIDSAFFYKGLHESLQDSITKKENRLIVDEIEAKYELEKKQNEILQKNNQIEEGKRLSLTYLFVAVGASVLAVLLIILIRSKIRSNNQLADKNVIIERSLAEKEILMREIHHRVKNNIQAIKSIINIQKRKTSSDETKESLNETLNRINAMAVIHNRLYQQKNIVELTSDTYLTELLDDILNSFGIERDENIQLSLSDFPLPTDELLTLGLVFNELVTNACKYGKSKSGSLELTISSSVSSHLFSLSVEDKGSGNVTNKSGFGSDLIAALIHKLKGKITYISDNGHKVNIEIPVNGQ